MTDLFLASRHAIESGAPLAFGLALLFGALSSVGPCAFARLSILSGFGSAKPRDRVLVVSLFLIGLTSVYVAFAFALQLLAWTQIAQRQLLAAAAIGFGIAGIVAAWRAISPETHEHSHERSRRGLVAALGLGALSACNLSPCCMPWLIMALSLTSLHGHSWYGAALMIPFSIGHALPLFAYGRLGGLFGDTARRFGLSQIIAIGGAAFLLLLCGYYAVQV